MERSHPLSLERAPEPCIEGGWIILNHRGCVWHFGVFERPEQARQHLASQWPSGVPDGFTVVRGKMTVEAIASPGFVAQEAD